MRILIALNARITVKIKSDLYSYSVFLNPESVDSVQRRARISPRALWLREFLGKMDPLHLLENTFDRKCFC